MPLINKPQNINKIWSNSGDRATPSDQKINQGWVPEIPPHQWFNYIDNKQDQAIAHINQMGIPQWDAVTEYQANKSYVQGPTSGVVYRALQTHTNQNPEVSNGFWEVAFLTQVPDYDTTYVRLNQNLADVPNKTQARNNLSVYSQAQVDSAISASVNSAPRLGVGQTWVNLTASRAWNTTYTNSTGKPIQVVITVTDNGNSSVWNFSVGAVQVVVGSNLGAGWNGLVNVVVPAGQTYRLSMTSGVGHPILGWSELR